MEYVLATIRWPRFGVARLNGVFVGALRHLHDHFVPHARNNYHPHILGHRALALFSALLVSLKIFTLALLSFGPVIPAFSSAITIQNIITLTNESRKSFALGPLAENYILDKAAQAKADDMLAKGYFAHNTPDGQTPWDFINQAGYNYMTAGENLAVNFTEAENVEEAWMNSPGHKANILNKNFEEIGIGIAEGQYQGHTAIFVVQMFGLPAEQKVTLTDTPTKVSAKDAPKPETKPVIASQEKSPVAQPATAQPAPEELAIKDAQVLPEGNTAKITANITSPAVKAIAYFGDRGIMLDPKPNGLWEGEGDLNSLAGSNASVKVKAFDLSGNSVEYKLADFSSSTVKNYNVLGAATPAKASWMGKVFDPKSAEQKFYLVFIAGILGSMIMAIGIKKHIQHLSLITNSSFVVILAALLMITG